MQQQQKLQLQKQPLQLQAMPKHSCPFSSSDSNYSNTPHQQQQHNMPSPSGLDQRPRVSATAVTVFCLTTFPRVEPGLLVMVASSSLPGGPSRKDVNSKTPSFNGSPSCILTHRIASLLVHQPETTGRRCGDIFCSSCCDVTVRLDQNAAFHPAGLICHEANSIPINLKENVKDVAETPMLSVPTDWAWSTF
ncbi:hypothetical protein BASA83_001836 [Batrachochytrium salamandrivorans]|nr:hypothetical protein BASA83_001836 [Batrachochytrium salamandrivorans]